MEQAVYAFRVEGKPVTCERYGFDISTRRTALSRTGGNMYVSCKK